MIYLVLLAPTSVLYSLFALSILAAPSTQIYNRSGVTYAYVVPVYNETRQELYESLESLVDQRTVFGDKRAFIIVSDGNPDTFRILVELLQPDTSAQSSPSACNGIYHGVPFIIIHKPKNLGKRDTLVMVRRELLKYNNSDRPETELEWFLTDVFCNSPVKYLIGIDGDTVFEHSCSYNLISVMETRPDVQGCVGLVDISQESPKWNPLVMYQKAEYMIGQCLKRRFQSLVGKVNCLSGCNQILRINETTCGEAILTAFNYKPTDGDSIFKYIRSYASEDRNHVCLMLSMFPESKTVQCIPAVCYTRVPETIRVFSSQRRRWTLGAITNDMLLVHLPGIDLVSRIIAGIGITVHVITPFIIIATGVFLYALFSHPSYIMLYLSISMLIPLTYYILAIPMSVRILPTVGYYYLCLIVYLVIGWAIGLYCYLKSLFTMDVIAWGKTHVSSEPDYFWEYEHHFNAKLESNPTKGTLSYINI